MAVNVDTTPAVFIDIDGSRKVGGEMTLEDFADHELKTRDHTLSALRAIAQTSHGYAKFARLALEAANNGQWPKAKRLWGNRMCAV